MANYVADTDVETYLRRPLTAAEDAQFPTVAAAATQAIDRYTGCTWDGTAVVAELHTVLGPTLRTLRTPVTGISLVRTRPQSIGAAWATLVAGDTYELLDAAAGIILLSGRYDAIRTDDAVVYGRMAEVTYTVPGTVPAPVLLAAEMLVAGMLASAQATANQAQGIRQYSVGAELTVQYFDSAATATAALPPSVRALLDQYRRPVMFG